MSREQLTHVERAHLPWRDYPDRLTECGLLANSYPTVSRERFAEQYKDLGQQRMALTTCMTCWGRLSYGQVIGVSFDASPIDVLDREIHRSQNRDGDGERLRVELLAIAMLVGSHREEFDALVASLHGAIPIGEGRKKRVAK